MVLDGVANGLIQIGIMGSALSLLLLPKNILEEVASCVTYDLFTTEKNQHIIFILSVSPNFLPGTRHRHDSKC